MRLSRYLALTISLTAALALAVPALAENGTPPDPIPGADLPGQPEKPEVENPVTIGDCLPDVTTDHGEGDEDENGENSQVTFETAEGTDGNGEGSADDTEEKGAVAACVLEALADVGGTAHAANIVKVVVNGIATGYPNNTFRPGEGMTRAQMASTVAAALDLEIPAHPELPDDVNPESVHAGAIAALVLAEVAQGKADGTFDPNGPVTREQMARFLDNAGLLDELPEGVELDLPEDVAGSVHADAIGRALGNGIAQGFSDGTFRPAETVERGQMATLFAKALKL